MIIDFLAYNREVKTLSQLQQILDQQYGIKISISYLSKVVGQKIGLSFKKVYSVDKRTNSQKSLLQRQFAALNYIEMMRMGLNIINIDESSIQWIKNPRKGWALRGVKRFSSSLIRIKQVSIIAGTSSQGQLFFTLNQGRNNSFTVYHFILLLIEQLDNNDPAWRHNTILMLDNAAYHRSKYLRSKFEQLQIPIAFLGPYQFDLAPIETLFSFIKSHKQASRLKAVIEKQIVYIAIFTQFLQGKKSNL